MKRSLDQISSDPESQPALASVIIEALKVDSLQKFCSSLEPILRRVVSEEVERALAKRLPSQLTGKVSPRSVEGPNGRNLKLHFRSKLSLPLFTGARVEGDQGSAVHIVLIDGNTGRAVTSGPESSTKLDIVVLEGDFNNEDDDGWTQDEFESHIVKEREGKRPLLTGDLQITLKKGVGTLGELTFTDNSSWIRSRKFRLGLKVVSGCCEGVRIREAKTEAFTVKDHRGELYKKHYPPALTDEVWRLEKIGKDGSFHKRLTKAGIFTVEDLLRLVIKEPQRLRNILGSGMSNKMWDVLVDHSKTCVLSGKLYVYYPDDMRNVGVVFNNIYELSGMIASGQYYSANSLSDSQKIYVDTLVTKAYENWANVVEYDGKCLPGFSPNKSSNASRNDYVTVSPSHSNAFDHQLNRSSLPVSIPIEQPSSSPGLAIGGFVDNTGSRYLMQPQSMNLNATAQLENSCFPTNHQLINTLAQAHSSKNDEFLTLGPAQLSIPSFYAIGSSNPCSYRGYEEYFTEEENRLRSHEMLKNKDMQHVVRMFNMNGHTNDYPYTPVSTPNAATNFTNNGYTYTPVSTPNAATSFVFDEKPSRRSGKAVVGWLKLKAALRWGIFVRKKAAQRRAQIIELSDC